MHYEDRKKAGVAQKVLVSMCESFTTIFKAKDAHETLLIWSRLIAKDYQVRNLHLTVKGGEHFGTEQMVESMTNLAHTVGQLSSQVVQLSSQVEQLSSKLAASHSEVLDLREFVVSSARGNVSEEDSPSDSPAAPTSPTAPVAPVVPELAATPAAATVPTPGAHHTIPPKNLESST